jgi:hypothetical protein
MTYVYGRKICNGWRTLFPRSTIASLTVDLIWDVFLLSLATSSLLLFSFFLSLVSSLDIGFLISSHRIARCWMAL